MTVPTQTAVTLMSRWEPVASSSSTGYYIKNGKIYTLGGSPDYPNGNKLVEADPRSFVVSKITDCIAKDKNSVFSEGYSQDGIDASTFNVLSVIYAEDAKAVYMIAERGGGCDAQPILEADVSSFKLVTGQRYDAQDDNHFYFEGTIVDKEGRGIPSNSGSQ